ncbi:MAG: hypothetical protein GXY87_05810 [Tissierellia bacterium]|nr:hypothetical protein [Tissierellia bacterium]
MKKRIIAVLLALVTILSFAACSKTSASNKEVTKLITQMHELYKKDPVIGTQGVDNAMKKFDIPEDKVKDFTSEELLELTLNHPHIHLISAYNDRMTMIGLLENGFTPFRLFLQKDDAKTVVASFTESYKPSRDINEVDENSIKETLIGIRDRLDNKETSYVTDK